MARRRAQRSVMPAQFPELLQRPALSTLVVICIVRSEDLWAAFDAVFELDAADEINVRPFEWLCVARAVRLELITGRDELHRHWLGPRDWGYILFFAVAPDDAAPDGAAPEGAAPEGGAEEPAEHCRMPHQVKVHLPIYVPPVGATFNTLLFDRPEGPAVYINYSGFLRFRTFRDHRCVLEDREV